MTRRSIVITTALIAAIVFAGFAFLYDRNSADRAPAPAPAAGNTLVRPHSPVFGPVDAPVTIVEFFDPSCEACREFHPSVKRLLAAFPKEVRLVLRYTPFHKGSDEAVRILETARLQGKFEPVLEALLEKQPVWASHGAPDLNKAWEFARAAGLDVERARGEASSPGIELVLKQDMADVKANNVRQTPTFFVNGKPLPSFGPQQLGDLVRSEVRRAREGS
ncbi:MAG: DsbA family protein [Burkholderiales bacterium]|nr:DsbA family protein [Burkholderiales bacterium]